MDSKPPELDKTGSPPEQEQIRSILDLVHSLTEKNASAASEIWRDRGWVVDYNDIDALSASRLTEKGEIQHPDYPLAQIRIFRKKDGGRVESKYDITKENGNLVINRYDSIQTPEEEQEKLEWKGKVRTMTHAEVGAALKKLLDKVHKNP